MVPFPGAIPNRMALETLGRDDVEASKVPFSNKEVMSTLNSMNVIKLQGRKISQLCFCNTVRNL